MTTTTETHTCPCHGEPMLWEKDARKKRGGVWRCRVRKRAARVAYNNSAARRASNQRRIFIGSGYVGTEDAFPYPHDVVERRLLGMLEEFRAKQAADNEALRDALAREAERRQDALASSNDAVAASILPPDLVRWVDRSAAHA